MTFLEAFYWKKTSFCSPNFMHFFPDGPIHNESALTQKRQWVQSMLTNSLAHINFVSSAGIFCWPIICRIEEIFISHFPVWSIKPMGPMEKWLTGPSYLTPYGVTKRQSANTMINTTEKHFDMMKFNYFLKILDIFFIYAIYIYITNTYLNCPLDIVLDLSWIPLIQLWISWALKEVTHWLFGRVPLI